MTKAQHTPAPWKVEFSQISAPDEKKCIVQFGFNIRENPQALANASLIAAAPDLLAALQMLIDTAVFAQFNWHKMSAHHKNMNSLRIEKARAAIAKATGE